MEVIKFGGSSVANAENIKKVIQIIEKKEKANPLIIVVSALGGVTDLLLQTANIALQKNEDYKKNIVLLEQKHKETITQLLPTNNQEKITEIVKNACKEIDNICNGIFLLGELSDRTKDKIVSYGELLSSQIIETTLKNNGFAINWKDARELIITDNNFSNAQVDFVKTNNLMQQFFKNTKENFILPGFIANNETGVTTTLGRGGSDYTAAIIAGAMQANVLEIWTDVSGMMTADPRIVQGYKHIPTISYQEAMELSHFGAKVIYPPTIHPVMSKNIPVWIKNTFAPNDTGTEIKNNNEDNSETVRGISSIKNISLLSLEGSGMVGIPGFSKRLFEALALQKINVILITQSSSEHSICVAIATEFINEAKKAIDDAFAYEIEIKKIDPLVIENDLAIVAIIGDNMKNHTGISGKMFGALGKNGINVRAIAQGSSERNISAVINVNDVNKAVNVLHEIFFENTYKQVHLFIAGCGNVGKRLLAQLLQQIDFIKTNKLIQIKIVGLANSKQMLINEAGIDLTNWEKNLKGAPLANIQKFIELIINKNLRNSIFIDVTANEIVANVYEKLLQKSISVIACNKIACSSTFANYKNLKNTAISHNAKFLFETNVGASLPIIGTINDLINSGDKVHKMQAVLSGTLNFVFNNYDGKKTFASVVQQAQTEGYTEPDPRLDLGGKDVMRKILILARESGVTMEMDDITNNGFMPESCMQGSVADFYTAMEKEEAHFKKLLEAANENGAKLKFVATYKNGKAEVGLQQINPEHDLYHLYGKDNIVLFYTDRYVEQPLVIKGAGAGADVTASGVFADIIRAAS